MDHLQSYVVPQLNLLNVPLLSSERFSYDGLGFDGFPKRMSFDVSELWSPTHNAHLTDQERLSFLQSWLYFAFAHEVFGRILGDTPHPLTPDLLVKAVETDHDYWEIGVTSAPLPLAATAWLALNELTTTEDSTERMHKVISILKQVHNILKAILYSMDKKQLSYLKDDGDVMVSHRILISILLLAEQIDTAFDSIYNDPRFDSRRLGWPVNKTLINMYLKLTQSCRTEICYVVRDSPTPHTLLVWQYLMLQVLPQRDHKMCTDSTCHAIMQPTQLPQHVTPDCNCSNCFLSDNDQSHLQSLIKEDRVPLLFAEDISNGMPQAQLRVSEFRPHDRSNLCIAVSHVWSDGLGNPKKNTMPSCQLLRLHGLAKRLSEQWHHVFQYQSTSVGFWIDTICVPRDTALKKRAIVQMGNIYKNASAVMVLDRDIESISTDSGTLPAMWQIYTSTWYRRLWTLQEGILNKCTFLVLADDMPTIEWFVQSYDEAPTLSQPLEEYRKFIQEKIYPDRTPIPRDYSPQLLDPVYRAVRLDLMETRRTISDPSRRAPRLLRQLIWRNTSDPRDESICLAILTSFPMEDLLGKSPDEQLAQVLIHLGPCSNLLVFFQGPRLDLPGKRWIPKTFLNRQTEMVIGRPWSGQLAQPTPEGLIARLPALVQKNKSIEFRDGPPGAVFLSDSKLHLRVAGEEYQVLSLEGPEGFLEAFFLGGHTGGGVILTEFDLNTVGSAAAEGAGGCLAQVIKVEGEVTYVTPVKACLVLPRQRVYEDEIELSTELGLVLDRDARKPILHESALWGARITSEAEYVPPKIYCIG